MSSTTRPPLSAALKRTVRFGLQRALRIALRLRARDYSVAPNTVALVLAPHPDDEVLGCGCLVAAKRLAASPVHVAYVTDGAASHPGHPTLTPAAIADRRAIEARAALRHLGVETPAIHFLGAPDGRLDRLPTAEAASLVARISRLIADIRPDEILLPFRRDGSSEHEAAFRLFTRALEESGHAARVLEFPVWSWWNPRFLMRSFATLGRVTRFRFTGYQFLKLAALAEYSSQIQPVPPWTEPVLSADFIRSFQTDEEFFFEA